jgi:hypothetical protein
MPKSRKAIKIRKIAYRVPDGRPNWKPALCPSFFFPGNL